MVSKKTLLAGSGAVFLGFAGCEPAPEGVEYPSFTGATGCQIEQITTSEFGASQFQGVSRDGKWLSYNLAKADSGPSFSVLMNLETGEAETLPEGFNNTGNFSADNKTLVAAVSLEDGTTDIVEINLKTHETTTIAGAPGYDWLSSYSPDQRSIAFNSFRTGNAEIYLYDRESGALKQLTDDPRYDAHTEFSPDGSKIMFNRMNAYHENGSYDFDLISYDLATGEETRLTDLPYEESYGSWAPDGQHLVFSSDKDLSPELKTSEDPEVRNLYVMAPDGKILARLTRGKWNDGYGYWMRDGSYIYFNSDRFGNGDIFRMPMNGLNCVQDR
ncbi:MAG: hypothetical protein V3R64_03190 [Sphingomonadales bacterium]